MVNKRWIPASNCYGLARQSNSSRQMASADNSRRAIGGDQLLAAERNGGGREKPRECALRRDFAGAGGARLGPSRRACAAPRLRFPEGVLLSSLFSAHSGGFTLRALLLLPTPSDRSDHALFLRAA